MQMHCIDYFRNAKHDLSLLFLNTITGALVNLRL